MSFKTNYDYITGRLKGLGFFESKETIDFENVSSAQLDKSFMININAGSLNTGEGGENLNTRMYDDQNWEIIIAFKRSDATDLISRNAMYTKIETIISDLDDPANYLGTVRFMRYVSFKTEKFDNYYKLIINILVQDQYDY